MHSPDLNSLNHSDFNLEQIGHDAVNMDAVSNFSAEHGLNLNYQDCQTHHYPTDEMMSVDNGIQDLSYTSMAESSFASLDAQSGMNLDYGSQDFSYATMAESSFANVDSQAAVNLDYGHHDLNYTNLAESSFHSEDSFSAMPRSTTPNYEDAAYHQGHEKFNHEMAQSWASGGYFDKAAEYEKTAAYHHDKIAENS